MPNIPSEMKSTKCKAILTKWAELPDDPDIKAARLRLTKALLETTCHIEGGRIVVLERFATSLKKLDEMPGFLVFHKGLVLDGCTALKSLPPTMMVHGTLKISNCHRLPDLRCRVEYMSSLYIENCSKITHIPRGWVLYNAPVSIIDCDAFHELHIESHKYASVCVSFCKSFKCVPIGFKCKELYVINCASFERIECCKAGKLISIKDCPAFVQFDDGIVTPSLKVTECLGLVDASRSVREIDELTFTNCHGLEQLPVHVKSMTLMSCR